MAGEISVEVVFATSRRLKLVALTLPEGASVADAIFMSGLEREFDGTNLRALPIGIWGRLVARDDSLQDGDRVEIYRPLTRDPREARRELARLQRLGSSS